MTQQLYFEVGFWVMVVSAIISPFIVAKWVSWYEENRMGSSYSVFDSPILGKVAFGSLVAAGSCLLLWVGWIGIGPLTLIFGLALLFSQKAKKKRNRLADLRERTKEASDLLAKYKKIKEELDEVSNYVDARLPNARELR